MKLVFATNNAHKLHEARQILPADIEILSLSDIGFHAEIEETGETLEQNSLLKADVVWRWMSQHAVQADGVFADDTGLEIAALSGAPGVYTARWAGEPSDPARNRKKALDLLRGTDSRQAQFRTVVTIIRVAGMEQVEGVVCGRIATAEYGNGGFGYDPVFIPEGHDATFAELPAEVKNQISHRARALAKLCALLS